MKDEGFACPRVEAAMLGVLGWAGRDPGGHCQLERPTADTSHQAIVYWPPVTSHSCLVSGVWCQLLYWCL